MELEASNTSFVAFDGGIQKLNGEDTAVILFVIFCSICMTGIGGNSLVFVVLMNNIRVNKRASGTLVWLANLSVTDLLILAVCTSVRAATYQKRTWNLGHIACRTTEWIQHGCLAAKCFTLAVMSKARHDIDLHPWSNNLKVKRILLTSGSIWVFGLLLPIADVVFSKMQVEGNFTLCVTVVPSHSSDFMSMYSKTLPLLVYIVPLIFSAVCNVRAMVQIPNGSAANAALRTECGLALLSVTAVNALLLLPEWSTWVWLRHHNTRSCKPPVALLVLAQVCTYLASACSPAILLTMLGTIRQGLIQLTCWDKSHQMEKGQGSSKARTHELTQTLPDLEHFWTGRRNTAVPDNTNPFPWEGLEETTADL